MYALHNNGSILLFIFVPESTFASRPGTASQQFENAYTSTQICALAQGNAKVVNPWFCFIEWTWGYNMSYNWSIIVHHCVSGLWSNLFLIH